MRADFLVCPMTGIEIMKKSTLAVGVLFMAAGIAGVASSRQSRPSYWPIAGTARGAGCRASFMSWSMRLWPGRPSLR